MAATAAMYSVLAPLVRNNMGLRYLPNPIVPVWSTVRVAARPLWSRPKPLVPITAGTALGASHAAASAKPPLLVLVVGETARADHFAPQRLSARHHARAGGARRAELSQRLVVRHQHAGVGALHVLSRSARRRTRRAQAEHENLLDVVQAAGMAVLWLDNQAGCKSVCARVASASTTDLAGTPAAARLCADGECLDEALLEGLDARIAALPAERRRKGVLLVMHQMGSHGPAYGRRSTEAYKRFKPECRTTTLGDCVPAELINVYDNSIAYTDHVLARTIDWLPGRSPATRRRCSTSATTASRSASTASSCTACRMRWRPTRRSTCRWSPGSATAWPPRARLDAACMRGRLDEKLSHDNLYHSVLGLLDVTTPTYDRRLDIWSACKRRDEG